MCEIDQLVASINYLNSKIDSNNDEITDFKNKICELLWEKVRVIWGFTYEGTWGNSYQLLLNINKKKEECRFEISRNEHRGKISYDLRIYGNITGEEIINELNNKLLKMNNMKNSQLNTKITQKISFKYLLEYLQTVLK